MSKKNSKKKSVDSLDNVFLEAMKDELEEELSVEEGLLEQELEKLEAFLEESEPEVEGFAASFKEVEEKAAPEEAEAGLRVSIAGDGMSASLHAHNCPPLELETLQEALRSRGVVYGIDEQVLANAVISIRTEGGWQGGLVVARGLQPSADDLITYAVLTRGRDPVTKKLVWMVDGAPLFFDEITKVFSGKSLEEINRSDLRAKAVNSYEIIATLNGEATSLQGYNVYGIPVGELISAPEAGQNVTFDKDDGSFTAKIFGYLIVSNNEISVLPPVWTPKDKMAMYFINFKQVGQFCFPDADAIRKMMQNLGVEWFAFIFENIEKMCARAAAGKELPRVVKIARGIKPIAGHDACFEFCHDTTIRAGVVREGDAAGSMDMRSRNLVTSVKKDTLLGEKVKARQGKSGKSIFGNKVQAPVGKDIAISYNEGVYEKKKQDDIIEYYAKIAGNVGYSRNKLIVSDVFDVKGDVDYATGNIEVKTGLLVGGSVRPGFCVKAGGNTIIKGTVEQGASVFVQGDLCVEKGIVGATTKVVVLGNLQVDFIQDAEVAVKGDIVVKSYIYNGMVRSGGTIRVLRAMGSKGGKVIGGFCCASNGIEVSTVGSPTIRNTVVSLQPDLVVQGKRQKLKEDIAYCDANIAKMLRTLGLEVIDSDAIKVMLAQALPEKRAMILKILNVLRKFVKHREEIREKRKQLALYIDERIKKAKIRVSAEFFEGNEVEIGEAKFIAKDDMGPSIFQLREGRIIY